MASHVATNAGVDRETADRAFRHVFINKHSLANGYTYFDEDYDMAQSWQRLANGSEALEHDKILVKHEAYEAELMGSGMSYEEAHEKALEAGYDYEKALLEWKRRTERA